MAFHERRPVWSSGPVSEVNGTKYAHCEPYWVWPIKDIGAAHLLVSGWSHRLQLFVAPAGAKLADAARCDHE